MKRLVRPYFAPPPPTTAVNEGCVHGRTQEKSLWNYVSLHSIDLEGQIRPSKEELEIICAE